VHISDAEAEENSRDPHKVVKDINSIGFENEVIKCEVKKDGRIMDDIEGIAELANVDQPRNLYLVF
jgi:hypothetical protein